MIWDHVQPDSEGDVVGEARREIARSLARGCGEAAPTDSDAVLTYLREHAPPLHDPFAGGGSIPLEAQRLGLRAIASDLNPLAALINKAMIELPPMFRNQQPVNPEADRLRMSVGKGRKARQVAWRGAAGLADDIRYYGRWMRDEAYKRIGHLYPKAKPADGASTGLGKTSEAAVIAWLWARTVPCPNPACEMRMPLLRTFQLSKKKATSTGTRPVVDPRGQVHCVCSAEPRRGRTQRRNRKPQGGRLSGLSERRPTDLRARAGTGWRDGRADDGYRGRGGPASGCSCRRALST